MPVVWSACSWVYKIASTFLILLLINCDLISGEVSISIDNDLYFKSLEYKKKIQIITTLGPSSLNTAFLKFSNKRIDEINMSELLMIYNFF